MKRIVLVVLVALMVMPVGLLRAQTSSDPALIWTVGQIDPSDNSVYYSLFVAANEEIINNLTITGLVPEGATFVKDFWKPDSAAFVGEADGTVTWTMDALGSDSIAGPFTFQVTFEDAAAEGFAPPSFISGNLIWDGGELGAVSYTEEPLALLEDTGSVTIDAAGTVDMVPVGNTGAWILVPEGAVSEEVTLTITKTPIEEDTALPEVEFDTWWCGQYMLTADKEVTFSQPLTLILPIRRALTPGDEISVFGMPEGGEWSILSDGITETTDGESAAAMVTRDALTVEVRLSSVSLGSTANILSIGIDVPKRAKSISPGGTRPDDPDWF